MSTQPTKVEFQRYAQECRAGKSDNNPNLVLSAPFLKNIVGLMTESLDKVGGHGAKMHDIRLNGAEICMAIAVLQGRC